MSNRSLRVCHLAYTFYEYDNRVRKYVETLAERRDHVDVIALRLSGTQWYENAGLLRYFRIQTRSGNEKGALAHLLKLILFWIKANVLITVLQFRRPYDVIHVHNMPDFLVWTAWLPKLYGARVILDIHDLVPELYRGKFGSSDVSSLAPKVLLHTERLCCGFADHVIIANHLWYDRITERSVASSKCTTIINYPDLNLFRPLNVRKPADKAFRILYPGSLNHHQGLDIAIRAFAIARARIANAEFHIYGSGPALEELLALTADLGLSEWIKFLDPVGPDRIAEVINSASVGVVPKRADGFGNEAFSTKTLEFMACGVPLIVAKTKVDGYYFNDDVVSFFTPGDAGDLARAIVDVYESPQRASGRVRAASTLAAELSWQQRRADYRQLVDSLAACSEPAAA